MKLSKSSAASSPMPEDPLRTRLRAEAFAEVPVFSPQLHQRTMAVLRANGLKGLTADARGGEGGASRWRIVGRIAAPLAAAAAVAIAGWIVLQPPAPAPNPAPVAAFDLPTPSPAEIVDDVTKDLGLPTAVSLDQGKYGYLDTDAQRLASFVADQLPTFGLTDDSPQTPPSPQ